MRPQAPTHVRERMPRVPLTPEEDAEFRRIGQTPVGDITQKELSRYHDLVENALNATKQLIEAGEIDNR